MFGYDALQDDELTLAVGDIVTNIDRQDGGWWEGEVHGKRGVFPENFVEVIEEESASCKYLTFNIYIQYCDRDIFKG